LAAGLLFPYRQLILEQKDFNDRPRLRGSGLRYLFENFSLDTDRRELRRGTDAIAIAPKVFDLLGYLIGNRERVVSKEDLISTIWQGRVVSDVALTTRLNAVRKRSAIPETSSASSRPFHARASALLPPFTRHPTRQQRQSSARQAPPQASRRSLFCPSPI
jgi:hypothetical protein